MGEDGTAAGELGLEVGEVAWVTVKEALEDEEALRSASLESSSSNLSCLGSSNK